MGIDLALLKFVGSNPETILGEIERQIGRALADDVKQAICSALRSRSLKEVGDILMAEFQVTMKEKTASAYDRKVELERQVGLLLERIVGTLANFGIKMWLKE